MDVDFIDLTDLTHKDVDSQISEDYIFNATWKNVLYFMIALYKYKPKHGNIEDFDFGMKIMYSDDKYRFELKNSLNYNKFNAIKGLLKTYLSESENNLIINELNNKLGNQVDKDTILDDLTLYFSSNEKETNYIVLNDLLFYFERYIHNVLSQAYRLIDNNYENVIKKNVFHHKKKEPEEQLHKCGYEYTIEIANLKRHKKYWYQKMSEYLDKVYAQSSKRKEDEMSRPPYSYIDDNSYFHFLATNGNGDIVGYLTCSISGMKYAVNNGQWGPINSTIFNKFYNNIIRSDNININEYIDSLLSNEQLSSGIGEDITNYGEMDESTLKTNCFCLESLSVDLDYSGQGLAHFLVYNALLFASNASELNIGIVTVNSVAAATKHIVTTYFGFTPIVYYLDDDYYIDTVQLFENNLNAVNEKIFYITNYMNQKNLEQTPESNYAWEQFNSALNNFQYEYFQNMDNVTFLELFNLYTHDQDWYNIGLLYNKLYNGNFLYEKLIKENPIDIDNEWFVDSFFKFYFDSNSGYTDILYIQNDSFKSKMASYAEQLRQCNISLKRKRESETEEELPGKRQRTKILFNMNHINAIFK